MRLSPRAGLSFFVLGSNEGVMNRVILFSAAAAISLLVACASKPGTQNTETAGEQEQSTGREGRTKYYKWEGDPYNSAEEAGAQLEGN